MSLFWENGQSRGSWQEGGRMIHPQIKTFLTVCEKGSFTKAAARLYITPSAVLQQMNALEERLGVNLIIRERTGIRLTRAGEYLKEEGKDLLYREEAIRQRLGELAAGGEDLTIGTSILEKCRLLYELWMLYSEEAPGQKINMMSISPELGIPKSVDLIESLNSEISWMKEWDFLEICRVPFGFAFEERHPLTRRERIRLEDLTGETVLCFENPDCQVIRELYQSLQEAGVHLEMHPVPAQALLWRTAFEHKVLLSPLCWSDILVNMTVVPCDWDYELPYGIFYRKNASQSLQRFLRFIQRTYQEGNARDIVPVFENRLWVGGR